LENIMILPLGEIYTRAFTMLILENLDKLNFCKGLSSEYQRRLFSLGEIKTYQPGDLLFFEGQSSREVYLLADGQVALEITIPGQEPMPLQVVEAGELLGWSPVLGLGVMSATARALTPCHVLALDVNRILALTEEDPKFALEFMRRVAVTLARRLNATRRQLLETNQDATQVVS
jgi:CRP-like cAMP-binding protein